MEKIDSSLPQLSRRLSRIVLPLNRFFDYLFHSRYNPLYRSGTLAVGFLAILIVTGLYLSFFYSVATPYASIEAIQRQVWLGRWIRALHRYATDGALIATFFHVLQLLVQGKTWGPRTLAWISGVVLSGALLLSAWSGYVMVWDVHGQLLAVAGARMLQVFPFLSNILGVAFNGSAPATPSFFFMNLFLHVAVPLAMFFGLWIHTARLARTIWFPARSIFVGTTVAFFALSVFWPAPLPREADLLQVLGAVPVDIFYGFWIPIAYYLSPVAGLAFWSCITLLLLSLPWWWRPSLKLRPPVSTVDEATCSGCTQCVRDCPYEAISMIPRPDGRRLLATVSPDLCVSCGICAASCDDRAIGPAGRTAREQMREAELFAENTTFESPVLDIVVVLCSRNGELPSNLSKRFSRERGLHLYPVECCGTVHSDVLDTLLKSAGGVFLLGCPARNCTNRDGLVLISERIFHKRVPFLPKEIERRRLAIESSGDGEIEAVITHLLDFRKALAAERESIPSKSHGSVVRRVSASVLLLLLVGGGSQVMVGTPATRGVLRVGTQIPGRTKEQCRPLTNEEKENIPKHMQRPEICEVQFLTYHLSISVDGLASHAAHIHHSGARGDSPLFINEEIELSPGKHSIDVRLEPAQGEYKESLALSLQREIEVKAGQIVLVSYNSADGALVLH